MYNEMYPYFKQYFPVCVSERLKYTAKTLDGGDETGAVFTDLSKAFDCIDHSLLIAKLSAYEFEKQSINFIYSYLTKRKQRTKVYSAVSSRETLFSSLPQGSVLELLLFNIYICDMFLETPANIDFVWYTDDSTPHTYSSSIKNVLDNLQGALEKMFHWFLTNNFVANAGKCHLLTSSKTPVDIHVINTEILNEERVAWSKSWG